MWVGTPLISSSPGKDNGDISGLQCWQEMCSNKSCKIYQYLHFKKVKINKNVLNSASKTWPAGWQASLLPTMPPPWPQTQNHQAPPHACWRSTVMSVQQDKPCISTQNSYSFFLSSYKFSLLWHSYLGNMLNKISPASNMSWKAPEAIRWLVFIFVSIIKINNFTSIKHQ